MIFFLSFQREGSDYTQNKDIILDHYLINGSLRGFILLVIESTYLSFETVSNGLKAVGKYVEKTYYYCLLDLF